MNTVLKAAFWMTGAILSFTSMAIAGRAISTNLDTFEIMLYRSVVGVFLVVTVSYFAKTQDQITRENLEVHFFRNLAHFAGQNLWFFSLSLIPLAQLFAIEFTSPLWVILMSPLILGERMTPMRLLSAVVGFVGILIVARPGATPISTGVITAALAAIAFAVSIMLTKRLTRTASITCILFYLTSMQAVFGLIGAGWDFDIALPTSQTAPWLLLIGCAGLMAHFCFTSALSLAPATVVVPIDFIRLPAIAVIGMLFYNEPLDIFVLIGAVFIFAGNYMNILNETRARA